MNRVILSGRLTDDPKEVSDKLATFSLAVEDYNPSSQQRETTFFDCKAFGSSKTFVTRYLKKGAFAVVEGRLAKSKRTVQGTERVYTDILCDRVEGGPRPKQDTEDVQPAGW